MRQRPRRQGAARRRLLPRRCRRALHACTSRGGHQVAGSLNNWPCFQPVKGNQAKDQRDLHEWQVSGLHGDEIRLHGQVSCTKISDPRRHRKGSMCACVQGELCARRAVCTRRAVCKKSCLQTGKRAAGSARLLCKDQARTRVVCQSVNLSQARVVNGMRACESSQSGAQDYSVEEVL